jgi:hypothetical protein
MPDVHVIIDFTSIKNSPNKLNAWTGHSHFSKEVVTFLWNKDTMQI